MRLETKWSTIDAGSADAWPVGDNANCVIKGVELDANSADWDAEV